MKITKQIFSVPPYISTTWANITSLSMIDGEMGPLLMVELQSGDRITIPGLEYGLIEGIFALHQEIMESPNKVPAGKNALSFSLPLQLLGDGNLAEKMGMLMQHNQEEFHAPPLPTEVLEKVSTLIKSLGLSETTSIPAPEEGCNCNFCQIARAIHTAIHAEEAEKVMVHEEPVSDEDLRFHNWNIDQKGDQLYEVTNPLDHREHYQVFLGKPIGCTCGNANCEHIRAVLQS